MASAAHSPAAGRGDARWTWLATSLVGGLLIAVGVWALPTHVQGGDAGEFATVMLRGGVPHPSGYPWMRLLGLPARLFESMGLPPASAAALPCAACGVAAWLVLHRLTCAWGYPWAGAVAVTIAGTSAIVVLHVNDSEVWGLHLLFSALLCRAALGPRAWPPLGLGALLGLALSHHLTALLLAPLAIGAAWPRRPTGLQAWPLPVRVRALLRSGLLGVAGGVLGLLPLLSLALGSAGAWRWGDTRSVAGLVHHVTRGDYGVLQLSLHREATSASTMIARSFGSLGEAFSGGVMAHPIAAALVLAALLALAFRQHRGLGRARWAGLAGALAATSVVFPAAQNIAPESPFGAWILERFDLLSVALWSPVLCLAIAWSVERLPSARLRPATWLLAAAWLGGQLAELPVRGRPAEEAAVEGYARDLLHTPEPGARALVFGTDDHRGFPILYAQEVLGLAPELLYVDAGLLAHPWYRARLRARWPELPDVDKPLRMIGSIWADPELADTPIYLANVFSKPASQLPLVPEGVLLRVLPADATLRAALEQPDGIADRHLAAMARYQVSPEDFAGLTHPRGHPWSSDLWHAYVDPSQQLAARLRASGRAREADAIDARLAELVGATPVPSLEGVTPEERHGP